MSDVVSCGVYPMTMRCVADGEIRTWEVNSYHSQLIERWYWHSGSGSCDCNRRDEFLQAGGDDVPDDSPCTRGLFEITGPEWLAEVTP